MTDARAVPVGLSGRFTAAAGRHVLPGVPALVRLIIDQMRVDHRLGMRTRAFVSGYPGSPLGTFDLELQRRAELLAEEGVVHQPALNEELAATAVFGSQVATVTSGATAEGVLGVWYGKAPGLDRATDAIRHGNYAGTGPASGVLVVVGDDPACKSSTLPSASEGICADLCLPILHPGDSQDILDLGRHAIALSRYSGLWSAFKIVTSVADGSSSVDLDLDWESPVVPEMDGPAHQVVGTLHQPFTKALEQSLVEFRLPRARAYGRANHLNRVTVDSADAWLGLIAAGHTYRDLTEALRILGLGLADLSGLGIRMMRVGMPWPIDAADIREFARGLDEILVVEERRPFIETQFRDALYGTAQAPLINGDSGLNRQPLFARHGALDAGTIARPLAARLGNRIDGSRLRPVPPERQLLEMLPTPRPPWFCSGCPHSNSTQVPEGALVGTGIGCHALASRMDPARTGTVLSNTQMGGEGAQWVGAAPFLNTTHIFQNIGDGTLAHSGWLAVRFAVAAGSQITFKLLLNGAVSMTGGQEALGLRSVPEVVAGLRAEGVGRMIITTEQPKRYKGVRMPTGVEVWDRRRTIEAQQLLSSTSGVTVLIHDQECAAELRRARSRGIVPTPAQRVLINERVCEGCGDCGVKAGCLSLHTVDTDYGPKTQVHQSSCNFDFSCLEGDCPSFTLVEASRRRRKHDRPNLADAARPVLELDEPTAPDFDDFVIRMPGIGGTGVVTAAQILGMAAALDGLVVHGLDQTGMSQKAGPVISDLRITREEGLRPGRASAAEVDLYLAFDPLVGLAPEYSAGISPERTRVVGSTSWSPPGNTIGHPDMMPLDLGMARSALGAAAKSSDWIDAELVATQALGRATGANLVLVGAAYQLGALPISAASIEEAIRQNGVAIDGNIAAFHLGRRVITEPQPAATETTPGRSLPTALLGLARYDDPALESLVRGRAAELIEFQSARYARRYLQGVAEAAGSGSMAFATAVADNLFKLMAYKDEYEVARLHLLSSATAASTALVGPHPRVTYLLHPPALRALGLKRKLKLGPWFTPVLRLLAAARRLRGTVADPFGYTKVRRLERALIAEYREMITSLAPRVPHVGELLAIEIASLPATIRGYEEIKLASAARYREAITEALSRLDDIPVQAS